MVDRGHLAVARADDGQIVLEVSGPWRLAGGLPPLDDVEQALTSKPAPRLVRFDARGLDDWDSALLAFLNRVGDLARDAGLEVDASGLPDGVRRLLHLAEAVPEKEGARRKEEKTPLLARVGKTWLALWHDALGFVEFLGQVTIAMGNLLRGRARVRGSDFLLFVQEAGVQALPIVTLISFLVGQILGFVGAVQLEKFGASIYVADLVGIAMVREMGAMMTAIVMAGRTGAAYAAQLGSMNATQETEALSTMGVSPVEFLVLPRMLALMAMMPLLCLYSDALGIAGGALVGVGMLKLAPLVYWQETMHAVGIDDLIGGIFKASVYGALVAIAGCLRGIQSGRSSAAVGEATTSAVVTSIVLVISACGIFSVLFYILDI
ncbi:MAG: ABC transporter permease [bacterium]|nr:ABC transporter permease [bacterium]